MITREQLLARLPVYRDEWVTIHSNQSVKNIIEEILSAHREFAPYYDDIAPFFDAKTVSGICENLYRFCKANIAYREESEDRQTTALPAGILTRGYGDCKHYASFCGGVLDALSRQREVPIKWHYCFASYNLKQPTPYHVFTVVDDGDNEIWIDPTPGAEEKSPVWVVNKSISGMPLFRNIAGIGEAAVSEPVENTSIPIPAELQQPIAVLLSYGILSPLGEFNQARLDFVSAILPAREVELINSAVNSVVDYSARMGSTFGDIFKGIQHFAAGMGMQVPRAAFLGLVKINAFGYANKLNRALQYTDSKAKLADLWERAGGTFSVLENTIKQGATQPAATNVADTSSDPAGTYRGTDGKLYFIANNQLIGKNAVGIVPVVAAAAISSAAIIVAAIMPVIAKLVDKHGTVSNDIPLDPTTGLPVGYSSGGTGILSFMQSNPLMTAAILAAVGFLIYEYY